MSWLGYTLGASLVVPVTDVWRLPAYWLGYVVVFSVEALTVFTNDLHDFESDRRNQNHGRFNGGSRVLVEGRLTRAELKRGCRLMRLSAIVAAAVLLIYSPAPAVANLTCFGAALVLGAGYTAPPLKLSHRGWGEITVAFVHSVLVLQSGASAVGGAIAQPGLMNAALPLFLAIMPSISLSGLPDFYADKAAGKRTLAVVFGSRAVLLIAIACSVTAAVLASHWKENWPGWAVIGVRLHSLAMVVAIVAKWRSAPGSKIDGVIAVSLLYILWFTLVQLFA